MHIFHYLVGPDTAMKFIIKAFLKGVLYQNGCYEICNQYIVCSLARYQFWDEAIFKPFGFNSQPIPKIIIGQINCKLYWLL